MSACVLIPPPSLAALQGAFVRLLPRVRRHAEFAFRHVRCEQARADYVAETVGLAWKGFLILARRGRDAGAFISTFALRCSQAVKNGRRLHRAESGKDVLAPLAQQRNGFAVESLPCSTRSPHEDRHSVVHGQHQQDAWEERLHDNTLTPVPEQVAFRIDFPAWLATLTGRERRLVGEMANNERTMDLSKYFQLSPARISQLRRELHNRWSRFCGDGENPPPIATHAH
jgi:hypothetical protein